MTSSDVDFMHVLNGENKMIHKILEMTPISQVANRQLER